MSYAFWIFSFFLGRYMLHGFKYVFGMKTDRNII